MSDPDDCDATACAGCGDSLPRRIFVERSAIVAAAALLSLGTPLRLLGAMRPGTLIALSRRAHIISYPLPSVDGVQIDRANEVILARWHGTVIAFNLACPHQRAPLRWLETDGRFECPKHHSRYTPDGSYISGRATRAMDRLGISRQGDVVNVDLDAVFEKPDQPEPWKKAQIDVG